MLMISKGMYEARYKPACDLIIHPYDERSFERNCYYFHLGALREGDAVVPLEKPVSLRKGESAVVFTLESFTLSERSFAILGPCSELFLKGLVLHNSPTIDPGFSGSLEMRLENASGGSVSIGLGMRLGKVVFFDVSDTFMDLDKHVRSEKQKVAWVTRERAAAEMRKFAEKLTDEEKFGGIADLWVEKTIDAEWGENKKKNPFVPEAPHQE